MKYFVNYSGTKESFKDLEELYYKHIVFIEGSDLIYTHGHYYGDLKDAFEALKVEISDSINLLKEQVNTTDTDLYNNIDSLSNNLADNVDKLAKMITSNTKSILDLIDVLVNADASIAINTFNEIVSFLEGIENSEDLDSIIASIEQLIANINKSLEEHLTESLEIFITRSEVEDNYLVKGNYVVDDTLPENGLYIYDTDGKFTLPDNWNTANNNKAVGVAILTDDCKFVVAKEDISTSTIRWGGYGTDISTLTNYTDEANAATDFDGVNNTSKIIAAIGNSNDGYRNGTAAGDCAAYTFPNGKTGYLGAAGEWQVARQNKEDLNSALTLIGGTTMKENAYWTSTEFSSRIAWDQLFGSGSYLFDGTKYNSFCVRAFLAVESKKPLKERVSEIESQIGDINTVLESIING